MKIALSSVVLTAILFAGLAAPMQSLAIPVDIELLLLVDISESVDKDEYKLQKKGYVNAFNDPEIQALIAGTTDGVAVAYAEWSGEYQQSLLVGWQVLTGKDSAEDFSDDIANSSRVYDIFGTAPGSAIAWGQDQITGNVYTATKSTVMDVSGDGEENHGFDTKTAAQNAYAAEITINGLAIETIDYPDLGDWYQSEIVTPGQGTLFIAEDFADFQRAVLNKIKVEVGGQVQESVPVPEPATMLLLGFSIAGLAGFRRKFK